MKSSLKKFSFFLLKKRRLKVKNKLKNDNIIVNDNKTLLRLFWNNKSILFTGRKPPEEIIDSDKFRASNVLKFINLNKIKIKKVRRI